MSALGQKRTFGAIPIYVRFLSPHRSCTSEFPPQSSNLSIRELRLKARSDRISDFATTSVEALIAEGSLSVDRVSDDLRVLRPVRRELHLSGSLEIPKNHVLELPAGSVIRFHPGAGILSYGAIKALGSKDSPVRFLPQVPESGFKGIAILGAKTRSVFQP